MMWYVVLSLQNKRSYYGILTVYSLLTIYITLRHHRLLVKVLQDKQNSVAW